MNSLLAVIGIADCADSESIAFVDSVWNTFVDWKWMNYDSTLSVVHALDTFAGAFVVDESAEIDNEDDAS